MLRLLQGRNRQELVVVRTCPVRDGFAWGGGCTAESIMWLLQEQNTPWLWPEKPLERLPLERKN